MRHGKAVGWQAEKVIISKFLKESLPHVYLICWQLASKKEMSGKHQIRTYRKHGKISRCTLAPETTNSTIN